jgi:hypothetical protein
MRLAFGNSLSVKRIRKAPIVEGGGGGEWSAPTGGQVYTKSMYLDGSNDRFQVSDSSGEPPANLQAMLNMLEDPTQAWTFDVEFRVHNGLISGNQIFQFEVRSNNTSEGYMNLQAYVSGTAKIKLRVWMFYPATWYDDNSPGGWAYIQGDGNAETDHLTGVQNVGGWHKATIVKTTSTTLTDIKLYVNGKEVTYYSQQYAGGPSDYTIYPATLEHNLRYIQHQTGDDFTFGSLSFYKDRALSLAEVNDIYDGGARAGEDPPTGGTLNQSKIMAVDPRTAGIQPTNYWYLDTEVDSNTTITNKIADNDLNMTLINATVTSVSSITTSQLPLFVGGTIPSSVYIDEETSFFQPKAGANAVVTWYSDADMLELINTGETYTWTPAEAGEDITLYTKNVDGEDIQTQTFGPYNIATAGYSTHSYFADAAWGYVLSPEFSDELWTIDDHNFAFTFWFKAQAVGNTWWTILKWDDNNQITMHGNSTYPFLRIRIEGTWFYAGFTTGNPSISMTSWNHLTFSVDKTNGSMTCFANGTDLGTIADENFLTAFNAESGLKVNIYRDMGHIANIGVYNNTLSDEEMEAINPSGTPGSSVNLAGLEGSSDKLIGYYKINDDTFDGSSDILTDSINENNISVGNSNNPDILKSTDRP